MGQTFNFGEIIAQAIDTQRRLDVERERIAASKEEADEQRQFYEREHGKERMASDARLKLQMEQQQRQMDQQQGQYESSLTQAQSEAKAADLRAREMQGEMIGYMTGRDDKMYGRYEQAMNEQKAANRATAELFGLTQQMGIEAPEEMYDSHEDQSVALSAWNKATATQAPGPGPVQGPLAAVGAITNLFRTPEEIGDAIMNEAYGARPETVKDPGKEKNLQEMREYSVVIDQMNQLVQRTLNEGTQLGPSYTMAITNTLQKLQPYLSDYRLVESDEGKQLIQGMSSLLDAATIAHPEFFQKLEQDARKSQQRIEQDESKIRVKYEYE